MKFFDNSANEASAELPIAFQCHTTANTFYPVVRGAVLAGECRDVRSSAANCGKLHNACPAQSRCAERQCAQCFAAQCNNLPGASFTATAADTCPAGCAKQFSKPYPNAFAYFGGHFEPNSGNTANYRFWTDANSFTSPAPSPLFAALYATQFSSLDPAGTNAALPIASSVAQTEPKNWTARRACMP